MHRSVKGGLEDIPVLQKLRIFESEARRRNVNINVDASYLAVVIAELERLRAALSEIANPVGFTTIIDARDIAREALDD